MKTAAVAGIVLGVLCVAWTFVMGYTGWYLDPVKLNLFYVVIGIEVAVLIVMLGRTARQGFGYGKQVGAGALAALIGGIVIFAGSYLFTTVAFPNYFTDLMRVQEQMLRQSGQSEADIARTMDAARMANTPLFNAFTGFLGTLITGVVCSLVIAAFTRARRPAAG